MSLITTVASIQTGGVVATLGVVIYGIRKFLKSHPGAVKAVENVVAHDLPHGAAVVVDDAVKFVEHLVESPLLAGEAAKGKIKASHVLGVLADTQAAKVAAQVLQAFGKGYSQLSKNQQNAAVIMARTALAKVDPSITDKQIEDALKGAESVVNELQGTTIFKAVQDLEAVNTAPTEAPVKA